MKKRKKVLGYKTLTYGNGLIMIVYGPVPSRRLGQSLGINNIPPKLCTYSCVYCQLGRTPKMQVERRVFYESEKIFNEVQEKIAKTREMGESIDYLTFVPDGEPTLDINLGKEINLLLPLGIKIAVITNSSLLNKKEVQEDLAQSDLVSVKVDSVKEKSWHTINRPYGTLRLSEILDGILDFSREYGGELISETMLIDDVNDTKEEIQSIADFLKQLHPATAYIAIPTRPPAEQWVRPVREHTLNTAYQLFNKSLGNKVEYLIGFEGSHFAFTGNAETDLLSITSVHPMRRDALNEFLKKAQVDWSLITKLIDEEKLIELQYENKKFYMRKLPSRV